MQGWTSDDKAVRLSAPAEPAAPAPVKSPLTDLLNHMEVAMWAQGVDPEAAVRVLNTLLWGSPSGGPAGGWQTEIPEPSGLVTPERVREFLLGFYEAGAADGEDWTADDQAAITRVRALLEER